MDLTELLKIISEGENSKVEFKRTMNKESAKDVVSFLNTVGGTILYGIDDDGSIVGIDTNACDLDTVIGGIEPDPFNLIEHETIYVENKTIVITRVGRSQRMYMYRKTVYMRIGSLNKPLSIEDIVEKAAESLLLRFDEMKNVNADVQDLDKEIVEQYFRKRNQYRGLRAPDTDYQEMLHLINAAIGNGPDLKPTNAGVLFFCKYPQRFILQASLRISKFRSRDLLDSQDARVFEGPLPEVVEHACDFIDSHVPLVSELKNGQLSRTTKRSYPLIAVREALVNALTHRNYFDSADVRVFIFPDSLEIVNPGGFPPGVTPTEPIHKPRNALISQYFFDLGYIEKYGIGIRRMIRACEDHGLQKPEFVLKEAETKVVFFAPGHDDIHSRILAQVEQNGDITSREIVRMFGVSRDTANRYLHKLLENGSLKRVGKGRSVKYLK